MSSIPSIENRDCLRRLDEETAKKHPKAQGETMAKKELGKLEVELEEVVARRYWFMYLLGNLDNRSPQCQLNQSNGFTCEIVSKCKPS